MTGPIHMQMSGALYATARDEPLRWDSINGLTQQDAGALGWSHLRLTSPTALQGNEPPAHEYIYHFLLRRSSSRFLLVSSHDGVDGVLVGKLGGRMAATRPKIDVPRLVSELTRMPGRFVMSAVWARVEEFGQSLKSIALYGADLANSQLFATILPQLKPHRVQLRDVATRVEVLSVATRGEVSFMYAGPRALRAVDGALQFLSRRGYIEWHDHGSVAPHSEDPTNDI